MELHFPFKILNGPTILNLSWSSDLKKNHGLARTCSGSFATEKWTETYLTIENLPGLADAAASEYLTTIPPK